MRLIFYKDAAKLLGVSYDTLIHAVLRGELTQAGTVGNKQQLIEEQVKLFVGINPSTGNKKRISYNSLTQDDKALWHEYKSELNKPQTQVTPDIERLVEKKIKEELAFQRLTELRKAKKEAVEKEERFIQDNPFLMRELTA